ncbi:MAG: hypothetical protein EXS50_01870 [Candidatus Taylorbacteria bacterium]|nr:hypothetical protein [Candidatus Taylorbacteria bacterium]
MRKEKIIAGVILAIVIIGITWAISKNNEPGKYDSFATCLKNSDTIFYGAFWCPHCQSQKKLFGKSAKLLPYVECSSTNGRSMLPVCKDKGIESYPTWVFPDASKLTGEIALKTLAEKSNCPLP